MRELTRLTLGLARKRKISYLLMDATRAWGIEDRNYLAACEIRLRAASFHEPLVRGVDYFFGDRGFVPA